MKGVFEDNRKRMFNTNIISKITTKLVCCVINKINTNFFQRTNIIIYILQETGLADVNEMRAQERPFPERRLRGVLEELATGCSRYISLTHGKHGGVGVGRTILDKERYRLCQREMVSNGVSNQWVYSCVHTIN